MDVYMLPSMTQHLEYDDRMILLDRSLQTNETVRYRYASCSIRVYQTFNTSYRVPNTPS